MLSKLNRSLVVYLLCAVMTCSMGMAAHTSRSGGPDTASAPAAVRDPDHPLLITADKTAPLSMPPLSSKLQTGVTAKARAITDTERLLRARTANQAPAAAAQPADVQPAAAEPAIAQPAVTQSAISQSTEASPAAAQPKIALYEISAHYLNVREKPDKSSPIVEVLERGTQVYVAEWTDNGWLGLRDGGYIHGSYAERLAAPVYDASELRQAQEVSVLSASQPKAEPAVLKLHKPTSKVESASGLTKEAIAELLEGTALENHGLEEAILEVEEKYGINAYFTIAVMKLESGNGKSRLARDKNNLFGLNATGGSNSKAYSFKTKSDSVHKFGSLIAKNYIGKGYTTIEKIAKKYCPPNPKWPSLVKNIMNRDHKKLTKANLV